MKELSLHILDIANNSIRAKANTIQILVTEDEEKNLLTIKIEDDGCGMTEDFLKIVKNPGVTTKTNPDAGMGIPLFEAECLRCGGGLDIKSVAGIGTEVQATFELKHKERLPIGNMAETMKALILGSPEIDFIYRHIKKGREFLMDTREIKKTLDGVPIDEAKVLLWIGEYIGEGLGDISK